MSPTKPSTPTPRRFLLSRRNQQQGSSAPHSTPRFQAPSSSARAAITASQRPPSASSTAEDVRAAAPVKLLVTPGKQRSLEDVDDEDEDDERVEVSSVEQEEGHGADAIEVSSPLAQRFTEELDPSEQQSSELDESDQGQDDDDTAADAIGEGEGGESSNSASVERNVKRRKLSITPLPAFSSPSTQQQDAGTRTGSECDNAGGHSDVESTSTTDSPTGRDAQQPTFRQVPRFKPLDPDLAAPGLPPAFSPQRRGAKYLTGGLAAELQSMLSAVKSKDRDTEPRATITVKEVRAGRRMYLVRDEHGRRLVLAGEGKLTGLGRRAPIVQGSIVDVGQLGWGVDLEGEHWHVHCDWSIVV